MKKYEELRLVITLIQSEDIVTSSTGAYDNNFDNIFVWNA